MPYGINNYSLYPEQPNAGLQNITGTGPQLNFEMDPLYEGVGDVGRDTEGVYRGQGTGGQPDYSRSLSAREYDIAQGFRPSNTNQFAPPTWNNVSFGGGDGIGTPMGGSRGVGVGVGQRAPVGGVGGVQFMPNSTPMGTMYRDRVVMPTGGEQPAPYNPRKQDDELYNTLKAMLADPDSFTGTEYFKDMMAQREQARLRARRGSRFSGKSMIDFERGAMEDSAALYDRRIQELLGGAGEERARWSGAEGADRAGYQMGADAWRSKLGAETGTYNARLADAWNRDRDLQQTTYAGNLERNLPGQPSTTPEDPYRRMTPSYGTWGRM